MWNETPIDSSSPKTNQSAYLNYFQKAGFVFGIFGAVLAFVFAIAHLLFWTFTDFYVGLFMCIGFLGQCLLYLSALHALRRQAPKLFLPFVIAQVFLKAINFIRMQN